MTTIKEIESELWRFRSLQGKKEDVAAYAGVTTAYIVALVERDQLKKQREELK